MFKELTRKGDDLEDGTDWENCLVSTHKMFELYLQAVRGVHLFIIIYLLCEGCEGKEEGHRNGICIEDHGQEVHNQRK